MKNVFISIFLIGVTLSDVNGQQVYKNTLETKPFVIYNNGFAGGEFLAYGLGIEYSRNISKKLNGSFFIGKGDINGGSTDAFKLEQGEKSRLGYSQFNLALNYEIVANEKLKIFGGFSYMISQFNFVSTLIKSGDQIVYRQVSQKNLSNYLIHIKMENKLGSNTFWTTQISYQPYFIDANEVIMVKTGIGYRF